MIAKVFWFLSLFTWEICVDKSTDRDIYLDIYR